MKIFVTLFVLMAVALSSAHFQCGTNTCNPNYSCIFDGHNHGCLYGCGDMVMIHQQIVNQWNVDSQHFVQVQVSVVNHSAYNVNNVIIGAADGTLNLRDNTSGSIWNIQCLPSGDFTLPSATPTINAGQTFNFGYINRGYNVANLYVKNIHIL
ncbi:hypothetical protein PPL_00218 [Heterostelium album PN500]|uniref:Carbohydrate binding domain-containing protein n=1 Tax=Heterostelium pallidum (strain ATCC 26659 / Pp 5 / PN500) TaxID=670386 RepID=D3AVV3_HETP5|nr:hypothetical protein PPL_00218 [Heterostelium album PN500]EFA86426.1 hypothetical protein PPL_00218 [Heterostelium album PN500]|eukprot:XP_020438531.1 hypothetical protein PPL_00218 [Heterostelium album PN500]